MRSTSVDQIMFIIKYDVSAFQRRVNHPFTRNCCNKK